MRHTRQEVAYGDIAPSRLVRLGGLVTMVGGVAFVAATVSLWVLVELLGVALGDESYVAPVYALLVLVVLVAVACVAILVVREGGRPGWLALVASLMSFIGLGIIQGYTLAALPGLGFGVAEELILLGVLLATVGLVTLGFVVMAVTSWRALPRWCGAVIIVGSPPFAFLGPLWGGVLLGGAWALMGYALFWAGSRQQEQRSRVR